MSHLDYNNNMIIDRDMNDHGDPDDGGDGEGVWSPDIEACFQEALELFPPCGRRKHILQEDGNGKMYGRNELIARHIKIHTGKSRTRKQVSSHIQVLARRKAKTDGTSSSSTGMPSPSSAISLNSDTAICDGQMQQHHHHNNNRFFDVWMDRPIVTQKIRLVEFSAFIEYPQVNYQAISNNLVSIDAAAATHLKSHQQQQTDISRIQNVMQRMGVSAQHHSVHPTPGSPFSVGNVSHLTQTGPTHPLGSNHQLTAQFNQASYMTNNNLYNHNHTNANNNIINVDNNNSNANSLQLSTNYQSINQQRSIDAASVGHHQISHQQQFSQNNTTHHHHHHHHNQQHNQAQTVSITRHSYIKIDYSQPHFRQQANNRLVESININQIFDKFPELEGLFHVGQPDAFFLVKFWADIDSDSECDVGDQNAFFGYSSQFETSEPYRDITCSTKICSYGKPLLEKVEKIESVHNPANGRHSLNINRSPMCPFMVEFIRKLRQVPTLSLMNSVLENFTVLQVITSKSTSEVLLCLAYVFEILPPTRNGDHHSTGHQYNVYKLTKD